MLPCRGILVSPPQPGQVTQVEPYPHVSLHPAEQDPDGCAPGGQNSPQKLLLLGSLAFNTQESVPGAKGTSFPADALLLHHHKDVSQSLHWELFPAVSSSPSPLSQPHFPPHAVASQSPGARGTRLAFDISSGAHTQSTLCALRPAAGGSPTAGHLARAGAASGTFPAGPHSSAIEGSKKPFCAAAWSGASVPGAQSGH